MCDETAGLVQAVAEVRPRCYFCDKEAAQYCCPRCQSSYCSIPCYRHPDHLQCSESFYKESVLTQLKQQRASAEDRTKTMDVLHRVANQLDDPDQDDDSSLDSDDEQSLAERMAGVDLDDADQLWERLTAQERNHFLRLCGSGEIERLRPDQQHFKPWWEPERVVQELAQADSRLPPVEPNIRPLASLIRGSKGPSPMVEFAAINVLFAYAYAARLHAGFDRDEVLDFISVCLQVSDNLRISQKFESSGEAINAAVSRLHQEPGLLADSPLIDLIKADVTKLLQGGTSEPHQFALAAFSHLKQIFCDGLRQLKQKPGPDGHSRDQPPWRHHEQQHLTFTASDLRNIIKRMDFFISWANERATKKAEC